MRFRNDYASFHTLLVSSRTGEGLDALRPLWQGQVSCFAGQSPLGNLPSQCSLPYALSGERRSCEKNRARRHTTRQAELWPLLGGAVLDTPGFSLFELE
jgi:ribosome biogenesis GTPase